MRDFWLIVSGAGWLAASTACVVLQPNALSIGCLVYSVAFIAGFTALWVKR